MATLPPGGALIAHQVALRRLLSCLWANLAETLVDGRRGVGHSYLVTRWRPNRPPGGAARV